jgi:hypothetical protein
MSTTNGNPALESKDGAASRKSRSGGGDKAAHDDGADTRNFIATHNVTKVARKAVPGAGEESADLLQDEDGGPSKSGT